MLSHTFAAIACTVSLLIVCVCIVIETIFPPAP
jgi:hypothetical protein